MKDKKKTKTIPRQVRWDKLDNTAHLFPSIAGESMTNVYRISVTLKEGYGNHDFPGIYASGISAFCSRRWT